MVPEEPAAKPSFIKVLNIVTAMVAITAAVLGGGYYIWNLERGVDDNMSRGSNIDARLAGIDARLAGVGESLSSLKTDTDERLTAMRESLSSLKADTNGHLSAMEDSFSNLSTDADQRLTAMKESLSDLSTDTNRRLTAAEGRLSHVQADTENHRAAVGNTLSRISALETSLSELSEHVKTFDTVYVFKHTFDFPKPPFELKRNEAIDLICTSVELPATDELREEKEFYRKEVVEFDAKVKFKFYTTGQEKNREARTMIRQETTCYKRTQRRNETVPTEKRMNRAPIKVRFRAESAIYRDDNGGTWSHPYNPSFDHEDGDSKTFRFLGLPAHRGPQVHSLTATIEDLEESNQELCKNYEIEVATRELDRCDLEVFVFAYLDSPPLPRLPIKEE